MFVGAGSLEESRGSLELEEEEGKQKQEGECGKAVKVVGVGV